MNMCARKNILLIFRSENLSRDVHVTKSEANKHEDQNFIERHKL